MQALLRHPWPGNVRELRHVIERAVVMCRSTTLAAEHLALRAPRAISEGAHAGAETRVAPEVARSGIRGQMRTFEKERILAVLAQTRGNQTMAARLLGVSRRTLTNKLNLYGIDRPRKGRLALDEAPLSSRMGGPPSRPRGASKGEAMRFGTGGRHR